MRLWFDFHNPPDVNVLCPIMAALREHECVATTRRFGGLDELLEARGIPHLVVGGHSGRPILAKALDAGIRTLRLAASVPRFDASIASLGVPSVLVARSRGRPAIGFQDGDLATWNLRACAPYVSRLFTPEAFNERLLDELGLTPRTLRYSGFKEQIAVSAYEPDPAFLETLPFSEYVVVRAEALQAEYVSNEAVTIVPELLRRFEEARKNVLFLPRYPEDRRYARSRSNVYVPDAPVNGLDACYYADAVLTGSGTLAREASVLGVPAASFFPGPTLLSVDREMISRGWLLHSRDPDELIRHAVTSERRPFDKEVCRRVLSGVLLSLRACLADLAEEASGPSLLLRPSL